MSDERGTPAGRFTHLIGELEKRFPHPAPFDSMKAPEVYALEAIDELKRRLAESEKAAYDVAGTIAALKRRVAELEQELMQWRSGGVTEELLRRQDGYIKVGKGCVIVREDERLQLTWTDAKPTTEGWYWWRQRPETAELIVYVYDASGGLHVQFPDDEIQRLEDVNGQWAGPIAQPEETQP